MRRKKKAKGIISDPHVLYEAAVQSVEVEVDFMEGLYRRKRGKPARRLREDFCGTAALVCEWVSRSPKNLAWGVDLDQATLDWGLRNHVARLGEDGASRAMLINADVRSVQEPQVDIVAAFNFSYWILKKRAEMLDYFKAVYASLAPKGIFVLDCYGGTEALSNCKEKREITDRETPDGRPISDFTYIWEQTRFNPVNNEMLCYISFKLADGTKLKNAYVYPWRIYTMPEISDILRDAGFVDVEIYADGWDDESDEGDGNYELKKKFETSASWLSYIVAYP